MIGQWKFSIRVSVQLVAGRSCSFTPCCAGSCSSSRVPTMERDRIHFGSIDPAELARVQAATHTTSQPRSKFFHSRICTGITANFLAFEAALPFSEETQRQQAAYEQEQDSLEAQRRLRNIHVPTNNELVKLRLRELGEPITLFGEGMKYARTAVQLPTCSYH